MLSTEIYTDDPEYVFVLVDILKYYSTYQLMGKRILYMIAMYSAVGGKCTTLDMSSNFQLRH
ncbi:MAG: hypothetical protein F4039_05720 [Gammaproteobacteria bacterium]|nr:hypothetical protein [Gammaproteobacteria bacterium]MYF53716.1 hypothetical protein [Gammaproteobacteria bacterium]MYK43565.1 hypothetical protein [Gammaproteobacteria bacterium]